jgi:hypothetical protein
VLHRRFFQEGGEYFALRCKNVPQNCAAWCEVHERRILFVPPGTLSKALTNPLPKLVADSDESSSGTKSKDVEDPTSDGFAPRRPSQQFPVEAAPQSNSKIQVSDMDVPLFNYGPAAAGGHGSGDGVGDDEAAGGAGAGSSTTASSAAISAAQEDEHELGDEKAFAEHHAGIEALADDEFFNDTKVLSR